MTTIVYRDGVLAADSLVQMSDTHVGNVAKIVEADKGTWIALAGTLVAQSMFVEFIKTGERPDKLGDQSFTAIVARSDGSIEQWDAPGVMLPRIDAPFIAEGTGMFYALGAMAMGATAEQVVRVMQARPEPVTEDDKRWADEVIERREVERGNGVDLTNRPASWVVRSPVVGEEPPG